MVRQKYVSASYLKFDLLVVETTTVGQDREHPLTKELTSATRFLLFFGAEARISGDLLYRAKLVLRDLVIVKPLHSREQKEGIQFVSPVNVFLCLAILASEDHHRAEARDRLVPWSHQTFYLLEIFSVRQYFSRSVCNLLHGVSLHHTAKI